MDQSPSCLESIIVLVEKSSYHLPCHWIQSLLIYAFTGSTSSKLETWSSVLYCLFWYWLSSLCIKTVFFFKVLARIFHFLAWQLSWIFWSIFFHYLKKHLMTSPMSWASSLFPTSINLPPEKIFYCAPRKEHYWCNFRIIFCSLGYSSSWRSSKSKPFLWVTIVLELSFSLFS